MKPAVQITWRLPDDRTVAYTLVDYTVDHWYEGRWVVVSGRTRLADGGPLTEVTIHVPRENVVSILMGPSQEPEE